jgi:hypothetical protein
LLGRNEGRKKTGSGEEIEVDSTEGSLRLMARGTEGTEGTEEKRAKQGLTGKVDDLR